MTKGGQGERAISILSLTAELSGVMILIRFCREGGIGEKFSLVLLFLGLGCFFGCQKAITGVDIEAEKALIKSVLDNYVSSIEKEDLDLYAKCVAHDADMVNFSAMGDAIIGWEALRQAIEGQNATLSETKINVLET